MFFMLTLTRAIIFISAVRRILWTLMEAPTWTVAPADWSIGAVSMHYS